MTTQANSTAEGTTDATPRLVAAWNTDGIASGCDVDHSTDVIEVAGSGVYSVLVGMSFSGSLSKTYQLEVYVYDDSGASWGASGCAADRKLGTGGDVGSAAFGCLLALDANDQIGVYHSSSDGGTSFTATEAQLVVMQVPQ
jgi:hypothetical protein